MPRLLSSYAANKRVEDGLRRKQEQIRLDYLRTTHRHVDETEKLVDELIQLHVRTPSAFQTCRLPSATFHQRLQSGQSPYYSATPSPGIQQSTIHEHNVNMLNLPRHGSAEQLALLRGGGGGGRSHSGLAVVAADCTTDDGTSVSRKEAPLPIVQVRGKEVFYQYENQRSRWKKLEPTYRTKMLLQRNDTVSNALRHFSNQRNQEAKLNSEAAHKNSLASLHDSDAGRRGSMFSRRGSRRDSRLSNLDYEEEPPPLVELKPQLSPGHTPRMLNGWTIMNWCLWNKPKNKPVWTTKKYMDRKNREFKRFHASRTRLANGDDNQPPSKPSSADPTKREARRQSSFSAQSLQDHRAKSVPVHNIPRTIDEGETEEETEKEEEEEGGENGEGRFPGKVRGVLRPTTSILRLPRNYDEDTVTVTVHENRPNTTQTHRRIALDASTIQARGEKDGTEVYNNEFDLSNNAHRIPKSKHQSLTGKAVKICAPLQREEDLELLEMDNQNLDYIVSDTSNPGIPNKVPQLLTPNHVVNEIVVDRNSAFNSNGYSHALPIIPKM